MNQFARELPVKIDSVVAETADVVVIIEPSHDQPGRDELALIGVEDFRRAGGPVATSGDQPGVCLARALWIKPTSRHGRTVLIAKVRFKKNRAGLLYFDAARSSTLKWSIVTEGGAGELVRIEARHPSCRRQPLAIS